MNADVSAVILTYDRDPSVAERALKSVLAQTRLPSQIFLADAGPYGERSEKLKKICSGAGPAVAYLKIDTPNGNERNAAAAYCTCKWICFLDDDDEWYPDKTEKQLDAVTEGIVLVASGYKVENDGKSYDFSPRKTDNPADLFGENLIGCTSMQMLLKKRFDEAGGFNPAFKSNQEWELWMRMLPEGEWTATPDPAGIKHDGPDTITADPVRRRKGWRALLRYHFADYVRNPEQLERVFWFMSLESGGFGLEARRRVYYLIYCVISASLKLRGRLRRSS